MSLLIGNLHTRAQEPVTNFPQVSSQADSNLIKFTIKRVRSLEVNKLDSALLIIRAHLATNLGKDYNDWLFEYIYTVGAMQMDTGNYEQSKNLFSQGLLQSTLTSEPKFNRAKALTALGNAYSYLSNFQDAIKYYSQAMVVAENDPNATYLGVSYNNMATALLSMKQYKQALYYLKKGEFINLSTHNDKKLSSIYNNIAVVYGFMFEATHKKTMLDSGIIYAKKALALAKKYNLPQSEVTALINLGAYYGEQHQPKIAIQYLLDIYKIKQQVNPYYKDIQTPLQLGSAYTQTGDYTVAKKYFDEAHSAITRLNNLEFTKDYHEYLANFYDTIRDYKNAYYHHKEFMRYSDSLLNKEKTAELNKYEVQYRTAQKDRDLIATQLLITEQQHKITRKNIVIITSIASILVLTTLLIGLIQRYRHKQKLQTQQIEVLQKDKQISNLQATIHGEEKERTRIARELHDGVGGTLAAVKMNFMAVQRNHAFLTETEDFREGMSMLDTMSNELRQAAHNLMPEMIVQHGLAESVSRYCEQIRKGRSLPIELQVYGTFTDLDNNFTVSVYRIIQELIHNIAKHAKATHAIVQLSCHEHLLSVVVEDDGIGFEPEKALGGLGLKNIRARVDSLHGHLTIESIRNRGTAIYLEFDLHTQQKTVTA